MQGFMRISQEKESLEPVLFQRIVKGALKRPFASKGTQIPLSLITGLKQSCFLILGLDRWSLWIMQPFISRLKQRR